MGRPANAIGIAEAYQFVDPATGALRGCALVGADVEAVAPGVATTVEAGRRLAERRRQLAAAASERGLALVAAGLHPMASAATPCTDPEAGGGLDLHAGTADPETARGEDFRAKPDVDAGALPAGEIPAAADARAGSIHGATVQEGTVPAGLIPFGPVPAVSGFEVRVRVSVPGPEAVVRAMMGAAPYTPLLLALSASSPFHGGRDTGYASYRAVLRGASPRSGPPPPIATATELIRLAEILGGRPRARGFRVAWDLCPDLRGSALEYRFLDCGPWLTTTVLLAALARALTAMFMDRPAPQSTGIELQLQSENRWRAAKYGLDAEFYRLDPLTGDRWPAREALRALIERLAPVMERLGDGAVLDTVDEVLARGAPAAVMRARYARLGSLPAVVRWLADETVAGSG